MRFPQAGDAAVILYMADGEQIVSHVVLDRVTIRQHGTIDRREGMIVAEEMHMRLEVTTNGFAPYIPNPVDNLHDPLTEGGDAVPT